MGLAVVADAAGASRPVSPADSASAASSRLNRGWLARTLMTASLLRYPIPSLGGGAGALRGCARGLVIEGGRMSHSDGAGAEPALGTTFGEAAVFPGRAGRAPAPGVRPTRPA